MPRFRDMGPKTVLPEPGLEGETSGEAERVGARPVPVRRDDDGCRLLYGHDDAQWATLPHDAAGMR